MNDNSNQELAELLDDVQEYKPQEEKDTLNLTAYDPTFKDHDSVEGDLLEKKNCRVCKTRVPAATMLDGLCLKCASKKLRELELGLVRFKVLKEPRKYCAIKGHSVLPKQIPEHKDWTGEISINGISLYPVEPLCQECLDVLSAWLVYFLEDRGFLRKGSGHNDNLFGTPYKAPLSALKREDALIRLQDFMTAASIYVANKEDPINELYTDLKERRKNILVSEKKAALKDTQKDSDDAKSD